MQEPDRDSAEAALGDVLDNVVERRLVQGLQFAATGIDASPDGEAVLPRYERRRQHEVDVVLRKAALGAHLDDVPKARSSYERGTRAATLDKGVCG